MTKLIPAPLFKDANLKASVALPNAANVVNTAGIDLGCVAGYPVIDYFKVRISTTAGTGANTKNITISLQSSSDNSSFSNVSNVKTIVIAESSGYAATERTIGLPPDLNKQYIRASAVGEANGGNAADGTLTIELVF